MNVIKETAEYDKYEIYETVTFQIKVLKYLISDLQNKLQFRSLLCWILCFVIILIISFVVAYYLYY